MTDDDLYTLIGQLQRHEDAKAVKNSLGRFKPYRDTVGKITIGWGRNLTANGISRDEADLMLSNDIAQATEDCQRTFKWFDSIDSVRQAALVNLCFNMGIGVLLTFERALTAMSHKYYNVAANEFLESKWARQVGNRAIELCAQIRTGEFQS
jgi:lysozyme